MKESSCNILNIPVWLSPGNYLGIPGEWGGSMVQNLQWLHEKVMERMEGWKGNLLNPAGKEVLIKALIQVIPSYITSIVKLPKTFCDKLTVAAIRFWWSNAGNKKGIH